MSYLAETTDTFTSHRVAAGLSIDGVAAEFSVPLATAQDWESGTIQPPKYVIRSLETIRKFSGGIVKGAMSGKDANDITPQPAPKRSKRKKQVASVPTSDLIKSKQRVADHGEVFTPPWLVEKMLDLVKGETERIDSRFLEPACGSGNFLVPILQRKLAAVEVKYGKSDFEKKHYALLALTSLYGIELLADNIAECRAILLTVFTEYLGLEETDELYRAASQILSLNLIHGDAMTMKNADGGPITVVEWSSLGKGKFNRRDFRLDVLTGMSKFKEDRTLFSHLGSHEIFQPTESYPPMTVYDLAAQDVEVAE